MKETSKNVPSVILAYTVVPNGKKEFSVVELKVEVESGKSGKPAVKSIDVHPATTFNHAIDRFKILSAKVLKAVMQSNM